MKIKNVKQLLFQVHLFSCFFWSFVSIMWSGFLIVNMCEYGINYLRVTLLMVMLSSLLLCILLLARIIFDMARPKETRATPNCTEWYL